MSSLLNPTISVSELRAKLRDYIEACASRGERFNISTNSDVEAVLIGFSEWKMLNETLDILADRNLMEQVKESEREIAEGEVESAEDVFGEIRDELGNDADD